MIDEQGYRLNVGIVLFKSINEVFLGKRIKQNAWQFPQGGLNDNEKVQDAVYRELWEEVGVVKQHVELLGSTRQWLRYKLPKHMRRSSRPTCIGQKQKWFLLKFIGNDSDINLNAVDKPEFDGWEWVSYWYALSKVIHFKKEVYRMALKELSPMFYGTPKGVITRNLDNILDNK